MTEDKTPTPDSINDVLAWHLKGGSFDNIDVVRKTNLWIHYFDLGNKGWGLLTTQDGMEELIEPLGRHGITIEPWEELPAKPIERSHHNLFLVCAIIGFPFMIPFMIAVAVFVFICWQKSRECQNLMIASGLKPLFYWTSLRESHHHFSGDHNDG